MAIPIIEPTVQQHHQEENPHHYDLIKINKRDADQYYAYLCALYGICDEFDREEKRLASSPFHGIPKFGKRAFTSAFSGIPKFG